MNKLDRDLTALLGSRICHDLISPLGAIGNGVELLAMSGLPPSPELSLISQSVDNASSRIRLFRIAFGAAAPDQTLSRSEILSVLAPFGSVRRIAIDWQPAGPVARDTARLALLALMCLESALAWGGDIVVAATDDAWRLTATADRLRIDPTLWATLPESDGTADVTAAEVHFPLAAAAAAAASRRLATDVAPNRVVITF